MGKLTHIDDANRPSMVDVSNKAVTVREARAVSSVSLPVPVLDAIDGDEIHSKKGPVFATAIIAGVMAAKKTHELIPFCHPLGLEDCKIHIDIKDGKACIESVCKVRHKTGVEMEALTAASVAALTIYDMCKGLSHDMVISDTKLMAKSGGKKDFERD